MAFQWIGIDSDSNFFLVVAITKAGAGNFPAIVARFLASVGDVESSVDPAAEVDVKDEEFNNEVEDVVAPFGVVPCRISLGSGRLPGCTALEAGAHSEEQAGGEKKCYLGPPTPLSEFFHSCLTR